MRRVLSILHLLLAVSALAQNTIPSSFAPMGRIGMGGFPAWDAVPYSFKKFLPALSRFVGAASTDTATTFGNFSGTGKWFGGVLAPNGCIYGIPRDSTSVLKIDVGIPESLPLNALLSAFLNKL